MAASPAPSTSPDLAEIRDVLIVEADDRVCRDLVSCFRAHTSVQFAATAEDGEQALRRTPFRLLICADDLPDRSGLMLLAATQDLWPSMQRVLLCQHLDAELMLLTLKEGSMVHYLPKPIDLQASKNLLAHALEQHLLVENLAQTRRRLDAMEGQMQTLRLPEDTSRGPWPAAWWRLFFWSAFGLLALIALVLVGFLAFYFLKSSLGVDFFPDNHLEDFLPL
jgi:DNA-binding NarL/FixJ family response regulator